MSIVFFRTPRKKTENLYMGKLLFFVQGLYRWQVLIGGTGLSARAAFLRMGLRVGWWE